MKDKYFWMGEDYIKLLELKDLLIRQIHYMSKIFNQLKKGHFYPMRAFKNGSKDIEFQRMKVRTEIKWRELKKWDREENEEIESLFYSKFIVLENIKKLDKETKELYQIYLSMFPEIRKAIALHKIKYNPSNRAKNLKVLEVIKRIILGIKQEIIKDSDIDGRGWTYINSEDDKRLILEVGNNFSMPLERIEMTELIKLFSKYSQYSGIIQIDAIHKYLIKITTIEED